MKTRLITAGIAAALFLIVLFLPWSVVLTAATSFICGLAVYEILTVTKVVQHRGLEAAAIVFAVIAPFFSRMNGGWVFIVCLLYVLALVLLTIRYHEAISIDKVGIVFLLSVLISISLSCLSYLRTTGERDSDGLFYVFLALLMAWMADSGAYFVGTFFGKHKLCPRISPKKTVEGLFGGIATSVLVSLLAGLVYESAVLKGTAGVSYGEIFVLALICAPLSVIGDLFASVIKRRCGVKDFGNLFPGHGGMMDRFDSLLFVLPTVLLVVRLFPLVYSI
ncbi:MAG: CDP-archaeol synthase [Clostridia bacterium]|nr:CDP-archaeol synthase [Clostridia bacterium]